MFKKLHFFERGASLSQGLVDHDIDDLVTLLVVMTMVEMMVVVKVMLVVSLVLIIGHNSPH